MSWLRGVTAETRALRFLEARGLTLIERNWRCKGGELDLVMLDGHALAVIEVRSRARSDYGSALESVDARKQGRLVHATQLFLAAHQAHAQREVRFDVVTLENGEPQWLKAAFDGG
ncbi:YraN family protein [Nevskia sp.]|uniref:YraN family protein n=1 Tax=Nevskia sp. TaxID=1929292 RepID=UPI0025E80068|nr:YraN family protein [Nevskia sp.]